MAPKTTMTPEDGGALVEALWQAVDSGAGMLNAVPGLVRRVLQTGAWKERTYKGKSYRHERFIDFITTKPLAGCGWEPDKVEALIHDNAEVLALWREAMTGKPGAHNNNIIRTRQGTGKSYTLDRLKRDYPDLFQGVVVGKLSANAAAIEAGFRKKPIKHCPKCGHEW